MNSSDKYKPMADAPRLSTSSSSSPSHHNGNAKQAPPAASAATVPAAIKLKVYPSTTHQTILEFGEQIGAAFKSIFSKSEAKTELKATPPSSVSSPYVTAELPSVAQFVLRDVLCQIRNAQIPPHEGEATREQALVIFENRQYSRLRLCIRSGGTVEDIKHYLDENEKINQLVWKDHKPLSIRLFLKFMGDQDAQRLIIETTKNTRQGVAINMAEILADINGYMSNTIQFFYLDQMKIKHTQFLEQPLPKQDQTKHLKEQEKLLAAYIERNPSFSEFYSAFLSYVDKAPLQTATKEFDLLVDQIMLNYATRDKTSPFFQFNRAACLYKIALLCNPLAADEAKHASSSAFFAADTKHTPATSTPKQKRLADLLTQAAQYGLTATELLAAHVPETLLPKMSVETAAAATVTVTTVAVAATTATTAAAAAPLVDLKGLTFS